MFLGPLFVNWFIILVRRALVGSSKKQGSILAKFSFNPKFLRAHNSFKIFQNNFMFIRQVSIIQVPSNDYRIRGIDKPQNRLCKQLRCFGISLLSSVHWRYNCVAREQKTPFFVRWEGIYLDARSVFSNMFKHCLVVKGIKSIVKL